MLTLSRIPTFLYQQRHPRRQILLARHFPTVALARRVRPLLAVSRSPLHQRELLLLLPLDISINSRGGVLKSRLHCHTGANRVVLPTRRYVRGAQLLRSIILTHARHRQQSRLRVIGLTVRNQSPPFRIYIITQDSIKYHLTMARNSALFRSSRRISPYQAGQHRIKCR